MRRKAEEIQAARRAAISAFLDEFFTQGGTPRCPQATLGTLPDSRARTLRCGIEEHTNPGRGTWVIANNPIGVMVFCCDAYVSCPVWQAAKDKDPVIDRVVKAVAEGEMRKQTEAQIRSGIRVDDRGLERQTEGLTTRRLDPETAELAAAINRKSVARRHANTPSYI